MQATRKRLLVGVSGSVATIKLRQLLDRIEHTGRFEIRVVLTKASMHFLKDDLEYICNKYRIVVDEEEWLWEKRGDQVLHVQLRKWADIFLVAPLSANTLAKIANGICDNTLTLVARCWDFTSRSESTVLNKPILVCPAMNSFMYQHPITKKQLQYLRLELKIQVVEPIEKTLMCGDSGKGAMASLDDIVRHLEEVSVEHQKDSQ